MALVRWTFDDPTTLESYTMEINPNDGGSPTYAKGITINSTSAPDGQAIIFEGQDSTQTFEVRGILLTEEQYNALVTWYQKRHQVMVTDDLERQFYIYITGLEFRRKRAIHYPWKHEYTLKYLILDWA